MQFTGRYLIPASRDRVWPALNDPAVLEKCIPGCTALMATDTHAFAATIVARIGVISATFKGEVRLDDIDPPRGYTLAGRANGGLAGFAKGSARVALEPGEAPETCVLTYTADADIGGKVAMVGGRLIQSVARAMADDFFQALVRQVAGDTQTAMLLEPGSAARTTPAPASVPAAAIPAPAAPASALLAISASGTTIFAIGILIGIASTVAAFTALRLVQ